MIGGDFNVIMSETYDKYDWRSVHGNARSRDLSPQFR